MTAAAFRSGTSEFSDKSVFMDNVLEQKDYEENMVESLKLVAGGVSHDFNNILTVLFGYLALTKKISRDDRVISIISEAEKACVRAKNLSQELMEFARGDSSVRQVISLPGLLKSVSRLVLKLTKSACVYEFEDHIVSVSANKTQISQVFMNLLVNAVQAMPEGGVVTIGIRNALVKPADGISPAEGRYAAVSIRDEGTGIPERVISRIFEKSFSTKSDGNGLGLAVSKSIVQNHGGHIAVESKEGMGTVFTIYLPACVPESKDREEFQLL